MPPAYLENGRSLIRGLRVAAENCCQISRQTRFGEVKVTLDAPQRLIIDDVLIAQANDRLPFNSQGFML